MSVIDFLLILIVIISFGMIGYLYRKNELLAKTMASFSPVQIIIGKVQGFTPKHEQILASNKEFLSAMIVYIDHKFALANEKIHHKGISNEDIHFSRGECEALLGMSGAMNTLLKRENKNDN